MIFIYDWESTDPYVKQIQDTIEKIKQDEEVDKRFMSIEELIKIERGDAKEEGRQEGRLVAKIEDILELLSDLGTIPQELKNKIESLQELDTLSTILKFAAKASSIAEFEKASKEILK